MLISTAQARTKFAAGESQFRKSWQAQYFVDVAKALAGVCHSKDCVLRGRCRESAPWILYFEVEGLNS